MKLESKYRFNKTLFSFLLIGGFVFAACNEKKETTTAQKISSKTETTFLTPAQTLGKQLFFDTEFSKPRGQSCAGCHSPESGFADIRKVAISPGATNTMEGSRNTISIGYSAFTPFFHYDSLAQTYIGGLFWDGHAHTLSEQATFPLFNHVEMNCGDKKMVVDALKKSKLKNLFLEMYGPQVFDNTDNAFDLMMEAIEEFEETKALSPFTSKYDYYLKGEATLTAEELHGLKLFTDSTKGKCVSCHPTIADATTGAVLFSDYSYDNLGVPVNPVIKNLKGAAFKPDLGLGGVLHEQAQNGKFKVPTLRNVALTAPYFHNGIYKTLDEVVQFYNTRNSGKFGEPEVDENVNHKELGDLHLTDEEVKAIVAFMKTLSDGYRK